MNHRQILGTREKKHLKSKEEWEAILLHVLLQQRHHSDGLQSLEKLEAVAMISGSKFSIVFRKNIEGIVQRLGEVTLEQNDKIEIDTVKWVHIAAKRAENLEAESHDLTAKYADQIQTIQKLNQQLDDLINAKEEHETALLAKFSEILNAKKLKIRDQQRLLAGAKVDSRQAAKVQTSRSSAVTRKPELSREGKRKAVVESGSEDEKYIIGPKHAIEGEEDDVSETINTPEQSDEDVTEDEDDDTEAMGQLGSASELARRDQSDVQMQLDTSPPPARELPFGNTGQGKAAVVAADAKRAGVEQASAPNDNVEDEDEETDDDDDDDDEL